MDELQFDIQIAADGKLLVDCADFTIPRNRVTFLFGESGIGKSLISRAVYGLLDPSELTAAINGMPYSDYLRCREVREIREHGFFVFQEPSSHLNPLMTLNDQMHEGSLSRSSPGQEALHRLWEGSAGSDLQEILSVYPKPYRPSGGEKQRILLAMALEKIGMLPPAGAQGPETLFVFDEPSGSLDNRFRDIFLTQLFGSYRRRPFTGLVITHDYSMISRIASEDPVLKEHVVFRELAREDGRIVMRDFDPARYTGWVRELERGHGGVAHGADHAPVLSVDHTLEVFGRRLTISPDRDGARRTHLTLHAGTLLYLKAPSGTGKTTLVKRVMGLIGEGEIHASIKDLRIDGKTPRSFWQHKIWGRKMTMVFQHADEALNQQSTMRESFLGLPTRRPLTPDAIVALAGELFEESEIRELLPKKVRFLSGGQKQRLNLLRGLVLDTDILILDEPLNGLDFESCTRVVRILQQKMAAGMAILVISHNEEIFDALAGHRICYLHAH
mgnify:CR=1 FL=1